MVYVLMKDEEGDLCICILCVGGFRGLHLVWTCVYRDEFMRYVSV